MPVLKRIVDRKDSGTRGAALDTRSRVQQQGRRIWLMVRIHARGRYIYEKLGLTRFDPVRTKRAL